MKSIRILCVLWTFLLSARVFCSVGPDDLSWESVLEELLSDEGFSASALEQMSEFYEQLHASPLNINTATADELESLNVLSPAQIESIHAYIYMYGPMKTLGELQLIGGIDWHTRQILRHLVYAGEAEPVKEKVTLHDILRYGRKEITFRMDVPLYLRDGFREHSAEELSRYPNRSYLGGRLSGSVR